MSEITECDYRKPKRLTFTNDEKRFKWLTTLLDAYSIIDEGVGAAISRE